MDKTLMYSVRLAEKKDCKDILNLLKELADFEKLGNLMKITEEDLIKNGFERNPPLFECIVAQDDHKGVLIGYALYFDAYSTWNGHSLILEDIMVTSSWRSCGVGGKLFDTVVARANARGCARVDFCVLNWNPAKEFYSHRGCENITDSQGWQMFRLKKDAMKRIAENTTLDSSLAITN